MAEIHAIQQMQFNAFIKLQNIFFSINIFQLKDGREMKGMKLLWK